MSTRPEIPDGMPSDVRRLEEAVSLLIVDAVMTQDEPGALVYAQRRDALASRYKGAGEVAELFTLNLRGYAGALERSLEWANRDIANLRAKLSDAIDHIEVLETQLRVAGERIRELVSVPMQEPVQEPVQESVQESVQAPEPVTGLEPATGSFVLQGEGEKTTRHGVSPKGEVTRNHAALTMFVKVDLPPNVVALKFSGYPKLCAWIKARYDEQFPAVEGVPTAPKLPPSTLYAALNRAQKAGALPALALTKSEPGHGHRAIVVLGACLPYAQAYLRRERPKKEWK